MPRPARANLAGLPLHIVQHGRPAAPCFMQDADYRHFLADLHSAAVKYGCRIHAYVLLPDHFHLLLTPEQPHSASRLMQSLGRRHAQHINGSYQRSGAVWGGRYKASVITAEYYLLHCLRYIELHPVRSGAAADPGEYPWSSYWHNALGQADGLLTAHPLYAALGRTAAECQARYQALFRVKLEDTVVAEIGRAVMRGKPLGGPLPVPYRSPERVAERRQGPAQYKGNLATV